MAVIPKLKSVALYGAWIRDYFSFTKSDAINYLKRKSIVDLKKYTSERNQAILSLLNNTVDCIGTDSIDRLKLANIGELLREFAAAHNDLFNEIAFPGPSANESGRIYNAYEDSNSGLTLYYNIVRDAKDVPPHNHTTWAVIAGVDGTETNRVYKLRPEEISGKVILDLVIEVDVNQRSSIEFMPDDIHSIHLKPSPLVRNFHLYGKALHKLENRDVYNLDDSSVAKFSSKYKQVFWDPICS